MTKNILPLIFLSTPLILFSQKKSGETMDMEFIGIKRQAILEKTDASTGLDAIYVLYDLSNASFQFSSSKSPKVYTFSSLGAAYSQEVPVIKTGDKYVIENIAGNRGYVIESGTSTYYMWIVDYSAFFPDIDAISFGPESDCTNVVLDITGNADAIPYYTINGRKMELNREMELKYNTLTYSENAIGFIENEISETLSHVGSKIYVDAPLCNTEFILTGDKYLRLWGIPEIECQSPYYTAIALSAFTSAEQESRVADNEQKNEIEGLGGSAPCVINFHASVTDAAIFREWQISKDLEFNDIFFRDNNLDFSYTFQDEGTTYVRFTASNDAATCDYYGQTYEVSIGSSILICPNAFSPGASEGINDEWKVSFKSIIDFECHIFNRWGVQVARLSHPSDGWDGKYKGKIVPSGVYYYVIKARGADGKNYNLKGDINIINQKKRIGSTPSPDI